MMKRTLSLILSVILILSVCVIPQIGFAAEGLSKTFSTADNAESLLGWSLPAGYVLSDADGVTHSATQKKVIYTGGTFGGKYEYCVDFKLVYENNGRIISNYIDDSNYYYIEINPKKNNITLKTFRRGVVSTHGTYDLPYEIKAGTKVTSRVISNGGEGMSLYLTVGDNAEATIFENIHVKDYIDNGTVGYDAQFNPLKVNNFKVTLLGEKDFVPPVEEEKPEETPEEVPGEEEEEEAPPADKVYDERPLEIVTALGIMDASALENGKANVTVQELKDIVKNLKSEYAGEDAKVTLGTAIEEIIKVLGYDVIISSRNTYYTQANSLKLLRGIDLKTSDSITRYDMAMLIYNALEVDVMHTSSYGDRITYSTTPGQTLLTYKLKMGKVEGQVTDNGVTGLNTSSKVNQEHFVIGGYRFMLLRNDVNRNDYIGRYVEAYYDDTDYDNKEILYIDYSDEEKVLVITPETYVSYNGGVFTYYVDGNRTKTATFTTGNPVIYNGHYITTYNRTLFDNITHGSITLVSNGTSNYTTMVVKSYESVYVSGIIGGKFYVYNKAHDGVTDTATEYDFEYLLEDNASSKSYVPIFDTEGERMAFEDIVVGDVVSIAKATVPNVAEMIVSRETVDGFEINEMYTKDGEQILSDFETEYKINEEYTDAVDVKAFKLGQVATLYLDAFGYVTWAEMTGAQEIYVGVLADSGMLTGINARLDIAIYETDGEKQIFSTADKIRFLDTDGSEHTYTKAELAARIAGLNEIVAYTLNDDDLITSFELPLDNYDVNADNHCTKVVDVASGIYNYQNLSQSWGFDYFTGSGCKYFAVPEAEVTDLEAYTLTSVSYDDHNSTCKMKLYSIDGDRVIDYGILYNFDAGATGLTPKKREMVVTGTSVVYDEESGLKLNKIQGFVSSGVTLYAEDNVMNNATSLMTYADTDNDGNSTARKYTVQKGDIIKYSTDPSTGRVEEIIIIYRHDMTSPAGSQGWILDAAGGLYVDATSKPNPFAINSSFAIADGNTAQRAGSRRFMLGWVYDKYDGIIEVTNQDLSTGATYWNESGDATSTQYVSEFHRISAYTLVNATFLDDKEGTITVKAGSASNVRSYKEYGRNCSRVLICLSGNEQAQLNMIILNEE